MSAFRFIPFTLRSASRCHIVFHWQHVEPKKPKKDDGNMWCLHAFVRCMVTNQWLFHSRTLANDCLKGNVLNALYANLLRATVLDKLIGAKIGRGSGGQVTAICIIIFHAHSSTFTKSTGFIAVCCLCIAAASAALPAMNKKHTILRRHNAHFTL